MRVYKDIISGDELCSDAYPQEWLYGNACMEVKASYTKKGSDQIAIASDDVIEEDDNAETVINIVDAFQLNEIVFTKKDFMAWVKGFLKTVSEHLEKTGKAERIPEFKKGATDLVKLIVAEFDGMQIFAGQSYNMDGALAFCYQKNQEDEGPTFLYFMDSLKEEKF